MKEVTATAAARNFADLLDAVEHRGEEFTIVRRGEAVARLQPVTRATGAQLKDLIRRHPRDSRWRRDLEDVRALIELQERS